MEGNTSMMYNNTRPPWCKHFLKGPPDQCYESDEVLLANINEYLQPSTTEWVFLFFYVVCFLVGIVGNALVVWAVCRNYRLRSTTNVLLTNLAVADFLAVLFCMPPNFVQSIFETWFMGRAMCKVVEYYQVIVVVVSILTLTAISVERWFAICRPLTFKQTRTRVVLCLVVIWLSGHVAGIPRLIVMETVHDALVPANLTVLLTTCAPAVDMKDMAFRYEVFLCAVFYALPIAVMGYAYTAVAISLWSSAKTGILTENDSKALITQLKARRRTAKMLIIVVIIFIVCFLPVYIWNMVRLVAPPSLANLDHELVAGLTLGAHLLLLINSCINPIIYNFMSVRFRNEFRMACICWVRICGVSERTGVSTMSHEMEPLSTKRMHHTVQGNYRSRIFPPFLPPEFQKGNGGVRQCCSEDQRH